MKKAIVLCSESGFLAYLKGISKGSECFFVENIIDNKKVILREFIYEKEILLAVSWREIDAWISEFKANGIKRIRIVPVFVMQYGIDIFQDEVMYEKYTKSINLDQNVNLTYLETHVTDICNLKCRGCMHFSNLATEANEPDVVSFEKDMKRLSEMFHHIFIIRLLGGEPLLSKHLEEYIKIVRKYFPLSELRIVTNGLLIPKMSVQRSQVVRDNYVAMDVSPYPPTIDRIDDIMAFLDEHEIPYGTIADKLTSFRKSISLKSTNEVEKSMEICGSKHCHFLRNGYIAKCPLAFFIEEFNQRYDENIPSTERFNIYEDLDASDLKKKLDGASELCKYCPDHAEFIEWKVTHNDAERSDWLVGEL